MKEQKSHSLPESKETFKIPESYFEDFDAKLFSKWESEVALPAKKSLTIKRTLYYSVAASFTLLLGLSLWFDNSATSDLPSAEVENYLQATTLSSEIVQDFSAEDFREFEKSLNLDDLKIDDYLLTSTDIEYYLNE